MVRRYNRQRLGLSPCAQSRLEAGWTEDKGEQRCNLHKGSLDLTGHSKAAVALWYCSELERGSRTLYPETTLGEVRQLSSVESSYKESQQSKVASGSIPSSWE